MQDSCKGCKDRYDDVCPLPSRMERLSARISAVGRAMLENMELIPNAPLPIVRLRPRDQESPRLEQERQNQEQLDKTVEICMLEHMLAMPPE
jgi:hypothetical protein